MFYFFSNTCIGLYLETEQNLKGQNKTEQQLDLERAEFLLYQAFNEDEENNTEEAVELYLEAVELCLKAVN